MDIEMNPVVSSNAQAAGYDPESKTLRVQFKGNRVYDYADVSADEYKELMSSTSFGTVLNEQIKPQHKVTRIS